MKNVTAITLKSESADYYTCVADNHVDMFEEIKHVYGFESMFELVSIYEGSTVKKDAVLEMMDQFEEDEEEQ